VSWLLLYVHRMSKDYCRESNAAGTTGLHFRRYFSYTKFPSLLPSIPSWKGEGTRPPGVGGKGIGIQENNQTNTYAFAQRKSTNVAAMLEATIRPSKGFIMLVAHCAVGGASCMTACSSVVSASPPFRHCHPTKVEPDPHAYTTWHITNLQH
jgi:hypothetical protein